MEKPFINHRKCMDAIERIIAGSCEKRKCKKRANQSPRLVGMLHLTYLLFLERIADEAKAVAVSRKKRCITEEDIYEVCGNVLRDFAG